MFPHIRAALWWLVALVLSTLGVGSLIGYPLDLLVVVLLLYAFWHLWQLNLMMAWVRHRLRGRPRFLIGPWRELGAMLRRHRQRQQGLARKMSQTVRRVAQLTHAVDEGIVVLDAELRLEWWNQAATRLLSLRGADAGQPLVNLLRDPAFVRYMNQDNHDGSLELPAPGRPDNWLLFTASRFGQGEVVLVLMDITRLKQLELTRKEFVANVSHELRTPLTVLRGYLETVGGGMFSDDPRLQKACEQMSSQVRRMQSLADDLLTLSRLEAQNAEKPVLTPILLHPLLSRIVEEGRLISTEKHRVSLRCDEQLEVMGLPNELHSAVGNLVMNAIRHNPQGANIEVSADALADGKVDISVLDDGVGISTEAIPRLTERFYRTDSSRSSGAGGTGLGLAIVKHALNRMGGSLEIRSRLGQGALFRCRLQGRPQS